MEICIQGIFILIHKDNAKLCKKVQSILNLSILGLLYANQMTNLEKFINHSSNKFYYLSPKLFK